MWNDYSFITVVVDHILDLDTHSDIIRFRSDNCSAQYKSKFVFSFWSLLAKNTAKSYLIYYGVSGHGKGLVDAVSEFGVKGLIARAAVFSFNSAEDIFSYFFKLFENNNQKQYFLLPIDTITAKQDKSNPIKMHGCRKRHMIYFHPDGLIQTKQKICSCPNCLEGHFVQCVDEKLVHCITQQEKVTVKVLLLRVIHLDDEECCR